MNKCKNCKLKFAWRKNLIYPIQLLIWTILRKVDRTILHRIFNFPVSIIFTLLMFLGEFLAGFILYKYQESFVKKKRNRETSKDKFIYKENEMKKADSDIKIYFLIFISSFFDFIEFYLSTFYVPKFIKTSSSLEERLGGILTIISALFFYYLLKFQIFRHQLFSLIIIGICLIIIITTEFIFQKTDIFLTYFDFCKKLLFIFFVHLFNGLLDAIQKYIMEYDFMNYFKILLLEGFFGFMITIIYSVIDNSYEKLLFKVYSNYSNRQLSIIIILLFLYLILCGGRNAFRVVTNKIYSPMTKTLTDYFINPIYLIINYYDDDFVSGGSKNIWYFLINLILSIIITLCGSIYNEIIILFFYDLETETYDQISRRATMSYIEDKEEEEGILHINEPTENEYERENEHENLDN